MRTFSLILFTFIFFSFTTNAKDYTDYHKGIIKAERQIFISNQVDSGLNTYMNVFKEFDFVFLHDCMTAMRVALTFNEEKAFLVFIDKATKNGLLNRHLPENSKIRQHPIYKKNEKTINEFYTSNRQHYVKRLDTTVIKKLYGLYEYDQSQKNGLVALNGDEPHSQHKKRYGTVIRDIVIELKETIATKGWISDKLAGIDQEDIFKEMKLRGLDLLDYYNKYKATNEYVMGAYDMYERRFASTLIMPILIHHHSYQRVGNLYDTSFYRKQIALGNIHPKDFALINNGWYFSGHRQTEMEAHQPLLYFGITGQRDEEAQMSIHKDEIANENRQRFSIAPIETDRAKWKFMKDRGWNHDYGFWGCRS